MKRNGYAYAVSVVVELTKEELDICLDCSARHYDGRCKAAGQQGGFLYGFKNQLAFGEDQTKVEVVISTHDLDTLVKILEFTNPVVNGLYWVMRSLLRDALKHRTWLQEQEFAKGGHPAAL